MAAQIGETLANTDDFRANLASRAAEFNYRIAPPLLTLSGIMMGVSGLDQALSVIIGAPGYRYLLYSPLSMLSYLHTAADEQILIKDGRSLELLNEVDTVVFDKTGTLTMGQPHVSQVYAVAELSERDVLQYAATAEAKQDHPIAQAISAEAIAREIDILSIDETAYEIGYGIQVTIDGKLVRVGSWRFMQMNNISIPATLQTIQADVYEEGKSLVLVAVDTAVIGAIVLQPTLRPEVESLVVDLKQRGLQLYIISGDHDTPTRRLAHQLGMDGYFAEVLPEDKANLIYELEESGRRVCFIGDGINDSIALKRATVSVSLEGAAAIATDTAQIVLMSGDLTRLTSLFELASKFNVTMQNNFYAAIAPCVIIVSGVFLVNLGSLAAIGINNIIGLVAFYNAVKPLLIKAEAAH